MAANERDDNTADREITTSRLFDAPRERVFALWTSPEHIARWWGPRGFSTTTEVMDFRPGGVWRHVMHGPDGRDYPNENRYLEIEAPRRIVYDHVSAPKHHVTVTFTEEGTRTRVQMRMVFPTAKERDQTALKFGAVEGQQQTLDRLTEQVAALGGREGELILARTFEAPRECVWRAWTEPERLARWWGPKGASLTVHRLELRPGGQLHYSMRMPQGNELYGLFGYREITAPERLVFVNSFADEKGQPQRNPWTPVWPLFVLNQLTLVECDGRTTLVLRGAPFEATDAEREAFSAARKSMDQGFGGTFEQLAEHLKGEAP
jgi:uncharacterized protein YndB with AHSA1/START domain